jgi:hypothetical protein
MPCVISVNSEVEFQTKSDLFVIGGSTTHSVVEELRSAPEPELETVDSSDHLHKIDHEVPWSEDSIQSSTSVQECWESVPGTWHKCQVETEKNNQQFNM